MNSCRRNNRPKPLTLRRRTPQAQASPTAQNRDVAKPLRTKIPPKPRTQRSHSLAPVPPHVVLYVNVANRRNFWAARAERAKGHTAGGHAPKSLPASLSREYRGARARASKVRSAPGVNFEVPLWPSYIHTAYILRALGPGCAHCYRAPHGGCAQVEHEL